MVESLLWLGGRVSGQDRAVFSYLFILKWGVDSSEDYGEELVIRGCKIPALPDGMQECKQFIKPLRQFLRPQGMILARFSIFEFKYSPHANVRSYVLSSEVVHLEIQKGEALFLEIKYSLSLQLCLSDP